MKIDYTRYAISLIITVAIFSTAFYISNFFSNKKINIVKGLQENISLDILSNEAQFDLLEETGCDNLNKNILSSKLDETRSKLDKTQEGLGQKDEQVVYLKKYYSLLQIKDYILNKKLAAKCKEKKVGFLIYMYSSVACDDCAKQGYTLDRLRELYPGIRIYTFDYDLDLSAIETLKRIYKLKPEFPILIINDKPYNGFRNLDDLIELVPDYMKLEEATSTATTTATTTKK